MKTRAGFVSNSSSSSYVLILRDEDYNSLLEKSHELTKSIIEYLGVQTGQLGSETIRVIGWMSGNDDSLEYFDADQDVVDAWIKEQKKLDDYEYSPVYDCWEDFVNEASKVGFKTSVDC